MIGHISSSEKKKEKKRNENFKKSFLLENFERLSSWKLSFELYQNCCNLHIRQGSTIIMKLPYVIMYVYQNFGIRDIHGQIPKSIYQASYLLPSYFLNNFS